jgi:hypothetical protein
MVAYVMFYRFHCTLSVYMVLGVVTCVVQGFEYFAYRVQLRTILKVDVYQV